MHVYGIQAKDLFPLQKEYYCNNFLFHILLSCLHRFAKFWNHSLVFESSDNNDYTKAHQPKDLIRGKDYRSVILFFSIQAA